MTYWTDKGNAKRALSRRASREADDVEQVALRAGAGVAVQIEESLYDDDISEEESDAETSGGPGHANNGDGEDAILEASRQESKREELLSVIGDVIAEREKLLLDAYPFQRLRNQLTYRGSRTLVYEFCLAAATVPDISAARYKPLQSAFERLSGIAMKLLLGAGADSMRTGFPPDGDAGLIKTAIRKLKAKMPGEWALDANSLVKHPLDGGVDVVAWKRVDDRPGSLIYVGNCACGKNWYNKNKHLDRASEKLDDHLSRPKAYHMNDFLSLPFHVHDGSDWREACKHGRFVLDRIRLTVLAENQSPVEIVSGTGAPPRTLIQLADRDFRPKYRT